MSPAARRGWPTYQRGHRRPAAKGSGSRRGFGATWWGVAWVDALEGRARLDPNRLPRGRSYARSGAVGELEVGPGFIHAEVQGTRARPYDVRVRVRQFDAAEWDRLLDVIGGQLGHTAALLDGELPPDILEDVAIAGLELLPGPGDLQPRCSCPDSADPCKHAAAVCFLVADALDADPFTLLLLRGRDRESVLSALRKRRGAAAVGGGHKRQPDPGVNARDAFARTPTELPRPPLPPARPGRPALVAAEPPAGIGLDLAVLAELAGDAALRAHQLVLGEGDGDLTLDRESDLARRAAGWIGRPDFDVQARRLGVSGRDLLRRALAWRYGGRDGIEVLTERWKPSADEMDEGRKALGVGCTARGNRLTAGDRQLRLGADGSWYPYQRRGSGWDPAGPCSTDPVEAMTVSDAPRERYEAHHLAEF